MKFIILFFTALTIFSCPDSPTAYTVLTDCNLIPMNKDTILLKKNIIIQNERIVAIEDKIHGKYLNSNTITIDCNNKFIIPGLFDSHFHYGSNGDLYQISDSLLLNYGVTNILSFHGSDELLAHKRMIDSGELIGPKIISTGRNQRENDLTAEEALTRLKEHRDKGFEFVKIYTHLSEAAFNVYNDNAEEYNLRLIGHIPRKIGFYSLMKTNQELICHAEELMYNDPINYLMGAADAISEPNYELIDTIVSTLKENEKWVSPTLVAFKSILTQAQESKFPSDLEGSLNEIANYWNWLPPGNQIPSKFNTEGKLFRLEKGYQFLILCVEQMNKSNVTLLAGTDSPALFDLTPGKSLHKELQLLSLCEISDYDVLKTATINPAQFLHLDKDYGTIEKNKIANLIILNKNPLIDIQNTEQIYMVILNGKQL